MKHHSKLLFAVSLFVSHFAIAQNNPGLNISTNYPEAGKKYGFYYNPKGTPLDGADSLSMVLYYFVDADRSVSRKVLTAEKTEGVWKGELMVPADAKAFYISLKDKKGNLVDNNKGEGHPYFIYENDVPVAGSKAFIATLYVSGNLNAGTAKNIPKAEALIGQEFQTYPASKKAFAQTNFNILLNADDDSKKALLVKTLYDSLNTNDERNYTLAVYYFNQLKQKKVADSITATAAVKFPFGSTARLEGLQGIYRIEDGAGKEKAYLAWISKFPLDRYKNNTVYIDYAINDVASAYAKENNIKKVSEYSNQFVTGPWKGEGYSSIAQQLLRKGVYKNEALVLLKKAAANALLYKTTLKNVPMADFAVLGYGGYNTSIAQVLYSQKKYKEALPYIEIAYKSYPEPKGNVNTIYSQILIALGNYKEAFDKVDEMVKTGQANKEMLGKLKDLYLKKYGSDKGYEGYLAEANKQMGDRIVKDLPGQMMNIPAKGFTLKDVDGNTVSLADYKGKIVVLDFWATWCGPCKASFPAMQMAQNKFKDDPTVKFLFIHTWERGESADNPAAAAKKYIVDNNYSFEVLVDPKDPETGVNKVVDSYGITGIPTKFIIDKNGNIRFRLTGFAGGDDAAVKEVSAMIDLARKS